MPSPLATTAGYLAGTLTTISFVPQVIATLRCKAADQISYSWLFIFASGVVLWLIYGLYLSAWPIIIANAATLALVLAIVVLKARYH